MTTTDRRTLYVHDDGDLAPWFDRVESPDGDQAVIAMFPEGDAIAEIVLTISSGDTGTVERYPLGFVVRTDDGLEYAQKLD